MDTSRCLVAPDDVLNVAGHRIGTAELESIFVEYPGVAESAVIGIPHELKGQAMVAFVSLKDGVAGSEQATARPRSPAC